MDSKTTSLATGNLFFKNILCENAPFRMMKGNALQNITAGLHQQAGVICPALFQSTNKKKFIKTVYTKKQLMQFYQLFTFVAAPD